MKCAMFPAVGGGAAISPRNTKVAVHGHRVAILMLKSNPNTNLNSTLLAMGKRVKCGPVGMWGAGVKTENRKMWCKVRVSPAVYPTAM